MTFKEMYLRMSPKICGLVLRCRYRITGNGEELHPSQMKILMQIWERGDCNQRALVKDLECSAASIATSIKRLERSGYVTKTTNPQDLRSTFIRLTERGEQLAMESFQCLKRLEEIQLKGFSEEEMEQIVGFQKRMIENMDRYLDDTK